MTYFILLLVSIGFAWLLYHIAGQRGSNPTFWAVMGFAFGPFAIPFVLLAKRNDTKQPDTGEE